MYKLHQKQYDQSFQRAEKRNENKLRANDFQKQDFSIDMTTKPSVKMLQRYDHNPDPTAALMQLHASDGRADFADSINLSALRENSIHDVETLMRSNTH